MLPELGLYTLIIAFCFAMLQSSLGVYGVLSGNVQWMKRIPALALWQFVAVLLSFLLLMLAFISNDFSVTYVAANSNSSLPLIYRICAVWGGHEGSMLLWVFILSGWTAAVALCGKKLSPETLSQVLVILGLVAAGFYLFILATSNPFLRLLPDMPINGRDLNPLLQDPGLVSHPPMLYLGYVGLSVPFAFAITALWQGKFEPEWAAWARPWTTLSWSFLTLGVVLGSWWAYRELGWGGWWFWDPVENASFLPWLVATALLHSLMVTQKRKQFKSWTVLLAIAAFSLSLIGTFLVRSGVLISVHAFAVDPRRGLFILEFLFAVIGLSLGLYAWRGRLLVNQGQFAVWSKEMFFLSNNLLLLVAMLTVLLGTLYPLLADVLHWGKLSVGAPYFNRVFIPLFSPLLFLMAIAPCCQWQQANPRDLLKPMLIIGGLSLLFAILMPVLFWQNRYLTIVGLFLASWLLLMTLYHRFRRGVHWAQLKRFAYWRGFAVTFAHAGMAMTVIGIVLASAYSESRDLRMRVGETTKLRDYTFQLSDLQDVQAANYTAVRADVLIKREGEVVTTLHPEYRLYTVTRTPLSKTDTDVSWWRDLYVALGSLYQDGSWSMRIYFKPFVRWIWIGGLMMVFGGLIAVVLAYLKEWEKR